MNYSIDETKSIKKQAVIYGIILGVVSLILSIISIYISKSATSLFLSSAINIIVNYVLFLALAVYFVLQLRKLIGGYWTFSIALKNIFIVLAISAVIGVLGVNVFNLVNPIPQEEAIDNTINLTIEMLEAANSSDEQIDKTIELLEQQKEALGSLTTGILLRGLMVSIILYFILALIFAAIFKREKLIFPSSNQAINTDSTIEEDKNI